MSQLLLAVMEELEGDSHVSFEGDLRDLALSGYPGASQQPTEALRRSTTWPKQDFIVVPLEPFSGKKIMAALGGSVPKTVLHIQIEKRGVLEFGAYDNFHPECIFFGSSLKSSGFGVARVQEHYSRSRMTSVSTEGFILCRGGGLGPSCLVDSHLLPAALRAGIGAT